MMKERPLRLFALCFAVMLLAACKSSSRTAASPPTPQAAPVAKFKITPPVTFSSEQIPKNGLSEFEFQTSRGQVLRVVVDRDSEIDANYSISALTAKGAEVPVMVYGGDKCFADPIYPLADAGTYRLVFDPSGSKHTLEISLLSRNDPLLDAGLHPEQIELDLGRFANKPTNHMARFSEMCLGNTWPANLVSVDGPVRVRLMQVAGYERLFPNNRSMSRLKGSLEPKTKSSDPSQFPYSTISSAVSAEANEFAFHQDVIQGEGWRAQRWVEGAFSRGEYDGGLIYTFAALTDDGRFFVTADAQVQHPEFERLRDKVAQQGPAPSRDVVENRLALRKALAAVPPSSFQPNLDELDAVIRSLKIRR